MTQKLDDEAIGAPEAETDAPSAPEFRNFRDILLLWWLPLVGFSYLLGLQINTIIAGFALLHRGEATPLFPLLLLRHSLSLAFTGLMAYLYLSRFPLVKSYKSAVGGLVALAGTFILCLPIPFIQGGRLNDTPELLAASSVVTFVGISFSLVCLAVLGRCFSLAPEARGLVTRGPYRWVRHPLYLGEIVSALGVLLVRTDAPFIFAFLLFCGLQYWRASMEEEVLADAFDEYEEYQLRTPYRVLPGLL